MFLDQLTQEQKGTFLALATRLVMADGEISDGEQVLLEALKEEMGGNVIAPAEQIFGNTNLEIFETPRLQVMVICELFSLAFSDEDLDVNEIQVLEDVSGAFGFPVEKIEAMKEWAKDRVAGGAAGDLIARAEQLMKE